MDSQFGGVLFCLSVDYLSRVNARLSAHENLLPMNSCLRGAECTDTSHVRLRGAVTVPRVERDSSLWADAVEHELSYARSGRLHASLGARTGMLTVNVNGVALESCTLASDQNQKGRNYQEIPPP